MLSKIAHGRFYILFINGETQTAKKKITWPQCESFRDFEKERPVHFVKECFVSSNALPLSRVK